MELSLPFKDGSFIIVIALSFGFWGLWPILRKFFFWFRLNMNSIQTGVNQQLPCWLWLPVCDSRFLLAKPRRFKLSLATGLLPDVAKYRYEFNYETVRITRLLPDLAKTENLSVEVVDGSYYPEIQWKVTTGVYNDPWCNTVQCVV